MAQLKLFGSARGGARVAKRGKKDKPARQKKPLKALAIVLTVLLCLEGLYFLCIYSNIPFIVKYRTIYINTAMNTMRHQWLATYFIPDNVIDKVRYEYGLQVAASNGKESQWGNADASAEVTKPTVNEIEAEIVEEEKPDPAEQARLAREAFFEVFWEIDEASMDAYVAEHPDVIANGWDSIHINEAGIEDEGTNIESIYGEQVLGIDAENGVLLLRVKGKGAHDVKSSGNGDLKVKIKEHPVYRRDHADVLMDLPVSVEEAILGTRIVVPTPDGSLVKLRIPAGTQDGRVLRVKGKGAHDVKSSGNGDLKVKIKVAIPKSLNAEQRAASEKFRDASPDPAQLRTNIDAQVARVKA